jgi:hypothetical protein
MSPLVGGVGGGEIPIDFVGANVAPQQISPLPISLDGPISGRRGRGEQAKEEFHLAADRPVSNQ